MTRLRSSSIARMISLSGAGSMTTRRRCNPTQQEQNIVLTYPLQALSFDRRDRAYALDGAVPPGQIRPIPQAQAPSKNGHFGGEPMKRRTILQAALAGAAAVAVPHASRAQTRSEERRVGKECRSRGSRDL